MKAKEFGARPSNDAFRGGQRNSANGYNKSFKKERFPEAQEYANRNLDEYHRFEGTKDLTKESDRQQSDKNRSDKSRKTENAKTARQRMLQQVVGITVGSTVVVTSEEEPATCENDGKITYTAAVEIAGRIFKDIQYKILPALGHDYSEWQTRTAPTCTADGLEFHTCTREDCGHEETNVLPVLGHLFGSAEEVTLDGGQKAIRFECMRCHEYFIIKSSIEEE